MSEPKDRQSDAESDSEWTMDDTLRAIKQWKDAGSIKSPYPKLSTPLFPSPVGFD